MQRRNTTKWSALILAITLGVSGCSQFHVKPRENYVYVTAKQATLRDRVAAVSNRAGTVENGEKLVVLEHSRRFVKVQTPRGEIGWLEDKPSVVVGQDVAEAFEALGKQHVKDPVVGDASVRDEVVLRSGPGRKAEPFYRLAEGDKLSLLKRATVAKLVTPGASAQTPVAGTEPSGPPMEDWWLVRDAKGRTGWIYSHMIDVTAPDTLARYAEGQRIVGAYVLGYADDMDSGMLNNGVAVTRIPEYVTVLAPYKAGLPYDFDQIRVFTWNIKKHRYETAMREKDVAGYLPVTMDERADPSSKAANAEEKLPSFTYRVLAADQPIPTPDPVNGEIKPGRLIEKTYRLEGNLCRRLVAPGFVTPPEAHPDPEPVKNVKKKSVSRKGR